MKYVFIVNPVAGKENPINYCKAPIEEVCRKHGIDYEFVLTERSGHATEIAASYADAAAEDSPVRVFSVGGDGTLCEVANGLMGKPFCELGVIPCGSGNDYIRTFGDKAEFLDYASYIISGSVPVDGIKTTCSGTQLNSLNLASLGFDANVCNTANQLKAKNKKLSSSKAYVKAIAINFFRMLYNELTVTINDTETFSGKYLFSFAANGQYYGGGYHSAPSADPTDGTLEMVLIRNLSRPKFLTIVGKYQSGSYFYNKRYQKNLITYRQGTKMHVVSKKPAIVNVDGECFPCSEVTFELMPSVIRFVAPPKYLAAREAQNTPKEPAQV